MRYRAQARTRQLAINGDTRANYNIINGGPRYIPKDPEPVPEPEIYRQNLTKAEYIKVFGKPPPSARNMLL